MSELLQAPIPDERVIESEDERYNARLVRRVDYTDDLAYFWVKFDGEPTPFEPGPVHDDRRLRRRQAVAAAVLGRLGAARGRRRAATSSTSGSCRSSGSRRCCGACRSATGCG